MSRGRAWWCQSTQAAPCAWSPGSSPSRSGCRWVQGPSIGDEYRKLAVTCRQTPPGAPTCHRHLWLDQRPPELPKLTSLPPSAAAHHRGSSVEPSHHPQHLGSLQLLPHRPEVAEEERHLLAQELVQPSRVPLPAPIALFLDHLLDPDHPDHLLPAPSPHSACRRRRNVQAQLVAPEVAQGWIIRALARQGLHLLSFGLAGPLLLAPLADQSRLLRSQAWNVGDIGRCRRRGPRGLRSRRCRGSGRRSPLGLGRSCGRGSCKCGIEEDSEAQTLRVG